MNDLEVVRVLLDGGIVDQTAVIRAASLVQEAAAKGQKILIADALVQIGAITAEQAGTFSGALPTAVAPSRPPSGRSQADTFGSEPPTPPIMAERTVAQPRPPSGRSQKPRGQRPASGGGHSPVQVAAAVAVAAAVVVLVVAARSPRAVPPRESTKAEPKPAAPTRAPTTRPQTPAPVVQPRPAPARQDPAAVQAGVFAPQPGPTGTLPEPAEPVDGPEQPTTVGDVTVPPASLGPPPPVATTEHSPPGSEKLPPQSDPDAEAVASFVSACDSRQAGLDVVGAAWNAVRPVVTRADQASRKHAERVARAVLAFRKKALDQVDAAVRTERQAATERWPRLAALRVAALAAINDQSAYAEADHGQAGQPAVDAAVGALREAWDPVPSSLGTTRVVQALAVVEATGPWLADLNVEPRRRGPTVVDLRAALVGAASSRSLAPTGADSRRRAADAKVRAWNDAAQMPADCREVVRLLNDYREMLGLGALVVEPKLSKAAERHCAWMASTGRFDHVEDVQGRCLPEDRCRAEGYGAEVAENLASGCQDAATAFEGWYRSAGHHRNMVSAMWGQVGTARSGAYWTQVFGAARSTLR